MTTNADYTKQRLEEVRASRDLLHRFRKRHAELVKRLPDGVRSQEDAAAWAEFYLVATVGPEEEGQWEEPVYNDGGGCWRLRKHVEFFVYRGLGPGCWADDEAPKLGREQAMWCLWRVGSPDPEYHDLREERALDLRAYPWQAAAWIEEVLPGARHVAARLGFTSADEAVRRYKEMLEGKGGP